MKSIMEIRQLLRRFGTFIYTGDQTADLELMEDEIRELFRSNVIDSEAFQSAMLVLRQELSKRQS